MMDDKMPLELSLGESFSKALVTEDSLDLIVGIADLALDPFLDTVFSSDIPVVRSLVTFVKTGISLRNVHLMKKTVTFLDEYHSCTMSEKSYEFREKILRNDGYREKISSELLFRLDRQKSEYVAKMFARLFGEYVGGSIDWDTLLYFSDCLETMQPLDFELLVYLKQHPSTKVSDIHLSSGGQYLLLASVHRLRGHGFVDFDPVTWGGLSSDFEKQVSLTELGQLFRLGLRGK